MKNTCSIVKPIGAAAGPEKRIPISVKYANVGASIDTGGNTLKVNRAKEQENVARYRKVEHFTRFGPRTLLRHFSGALARESMGQGPTAESPALLLLDVRDIAQYEQCHLPTAIHFHPPRMNHATSPFPAEVLAFRNVPNHLVVMYDWDEATAPDVANIAFEKGIDNVVVLTGGLRYYLQFSDAVVGAPPPGTPILTRVDDTTSMVTSVAPKSTGPPRRVSASGPPGGAPAARGSGMMSLGAGSKGASAGGWRP